MNPKIKKFVSHLFYENQQIFLTSEVNEMFKELLTIENSRYTIESTNTEYAVNENVLL